MIMTFFCFWAHRMGEHIGGLPFNLGAGEHIAGLGSHREDVLGHRRLDPLLEVLGRDAPGGPGALHLPLRHPCPVKIKCCIVLFLKAGEHAR